MPDVRLRHPNTCRVPRPRGEGRYLISLQVRAVPPAAGVCRTPERDGTPVAAEPSETFRSLAHCGGARTPRACSVRHGRVPVRLSAGPARPTFSSPSTAGIYIGRLSAGVPGASASPRGLQWGTTRGSVRGLIRSAALNKHLPRVDRHRGPAVQPLRATSASLKPRNLTPACSGLAALAADARR